MMDTSDDLNNEDKKESRDYLINEPQIQFDLKEKEFFYQSISERAEIYDPLDRNIVVDQ